MLRVKEHVYRLSLKHSIEGWLEGLVEIPNEIHSLSDIINFTKTDLRESYPQRDIKRWEWIKDGPEYNSMEYKEFLEKMYRLSGEQGIIGAMDEHQLDAIVYPTNTDPATTFTARLGLPAITVPLGFYPEDTTPISHRGDIYNVAPNVPLVFYR